MDYELRDTCARPHAVRECRLVRRPLLTLKNALIFLDNTVRNQLLRRRVRGKAVRLNLGVGGLPAPCSVT